MAHKLVAVSLALALGGCATTGTGSGLTGTAINNAIVQDCGIFISDASTLAQLVATGNATLTGAVAIGDAVCAAYLAAQGPAPAKSRRALRRLTAPIAVNIGGTIISIKGINPI